MCGEQFPPWACLRPLFGSPPRVRGTDFCCLFESITNRITPACAGNSKKEEPTWNKPQDHPRVCGEQHLSAPPISPSPGSPPRVRGTVNGLYQSYYRMRITPACAGNRSHPASCSDLPWDHPRVCGEQLSGAACRHAGGGSPPRVRGTGIRRCISSAHSRITPACAGNSPSDGAKGGNQQDHPRVCGEQFIVAVAHDDAGGSPPRVRGTGKAFERSARFSRITPACAGNSFIF